MAEILKFFHALIIFLFLNAFVTNASMYLFTPISNFILYHIDNHLFLFSNIILFLYDITDIFFCNTDEDCTWNLCRQSWVQKCCLHMCSCEKD